MYLMPETSQTESPQSIIIKMLHLIKCYGQC